MKYCCQHPCDHHFNYASYNGKYVCYGCGEDITRLVLSAKKIKTCYICQEKFIAYHGKKKYCPLCQIKYPTWWLKNTVINKIRLKNI